MPRARGIATITLLLVVLALGALSGRADAGGVVGSFFDGTYLHREVRHAEVTGDDLVNVYRLRPPQAESANNNVTSSNERLLIPFTVHDASTGTVEVVLRMDLFPDYFRMCLWKDNDEASGSDEPLASVHDSRVEVCKTCSDFFDECVQESHFRYNIRPNRVHPPYNFRMVARIEDRVKGNWGVTIEAAKPLPHHSRVQLELEVTQREYLFWPVLFCLVLLGLVSAAGLLLAVSALLSWLRPVREVTYGPDVDEDGFPQRPSLRSAAVLRFRELSSWFSQLRAYRALGTNDDAEMLQVPAVAQPGPPVAAPALAPTGPAAATDPLAIDDENDEAAEAAGNAEAQQQQQQQHGHTNSSSSSSQQGTEGEAATEEGGAAAAAAAAEGSVTLQITPAEALRRVGVLLRPLPPTAEEEEEGEDEEDMLCRICRSTEPRADLFAPCACRGSVRYVHRACLEEWRSKTTNPLNRRFCSECRHPFRVVVKDGSLDFALFVLRGGVIICLKLVSIEVFLIATGLWVKAVAALLQGDIRAVDWRPGTIYHHFLGANCLVAYLLHCRMFGDSLESLLPDRPRAVRLVLLLSLLLEFYTGYLAHVITWFLSSVLWDWEVHYTSGTVFVFMYYLYLHESVVSFRRRWAAEHRTELVVEPPAVVQAAR